MLCGRGRVIDTRKASIFSGSYRIMHKNLDQIMQLMVDYNSHRIYIVYLYMPCNTVGEAIPSPMDKAGGRLRCLVEISRTPALVRIIRVSIRCPFTGNCTLFQPHIVK